MTEAAKEKAAEIGAELIGKLADLGGRGLEGLFTNPWTGVPLALIILARIDPSGKLTAEFLVNLATFLGGLGKVAGEALARFGKGVISNLTGNIVGEGDFCYAPVAFFANFDVFKLPFPSTGIVPTEQWYCFLDAASRDQAIAAAKNRLGLLAGIYDFRKTDKRPA